MPDFWDGDFLFLFSLFFTGGLFGYFYDLGSWRNGKLEECLLRVGL